METRSVAFVIPAGTANYYAFPGAHTFAQGASVCVGDIEGIALTSDTARDLVVEVYDARDATDKNLQSTGRAPGFIDLTGAGAVRTNREVFGAALAGGVTLVPSALLSSLLLRANASTDWWQIVAHCAAGMIVRVVPTGGVTAAIVTLTVSYRPEQAASNKMRSRSAGGRSS